MLTTAVTARVVSIVLAVVTVAVYWQVGRYEFVHFDDGYYVAENAVVQAGVTLRGVIWAFTTSHASNWHPLTWLSHMLDCQIFGLDPGSHHLVNVMLHVANTLLLFALLRRITGELWRSAIVAALFAWHPLHVESIAWVSERKDVLSVLFGLLTVWAYAGYVDNPARRQYALCLGLFALALMAKPMLVTLPFVLLLLDYWPLRRTTWLRSTVGPARQTRTRWLIAEKVPFLALSTISCLLTYWAQRGGGAVWKLETLPFGFRLASALVSYAQYLWKTIWPVNLAAFYPYARHLQQWQVIGAVLLVLGVSVMALRTARKYPYVAVGWFWYLGTLVPVIGLVQVGLQSIADRYMYFPSIGLFVAVVWGLVELCARQPRLKPVAIGACAAILGACVVLSFFQVRVWANTETLFRHSLAVTGSNPVAHGNLAAGLMKQGKLEEAIHHFTEAMLLEPGNADSHNNLAIALAMHGENEEAIRHFTEAVRLKPDQADIRMNLGSLLLALDRLPEAREQLAAAVRLNPNDDEARSKLATILDKTTNGGQANPLSD